MAVCYSGDLHASTEALGRIRALGDPVLDLLAEQPYTQVQSYLDDTEPKGNHYYWKTEYVAELSDDLLGRRCATCSPECSIREELGLLHLAGALNERDANDGAVGNRDARFAMGANAMWEPGEPGADTFPRWIRDAWERLRTFSTGGNYINFQTAEEDETRLGQHTEPTSIGSSRSRRDTTQRTCSA